MRPGNLVEIDGVSISYATRRGEVPAVVDVSLAIGEGEAVGLVGESGCGKSTLAAAMLRCFNGSARIVKGGIRFEGRDIAGLGDEEMRCLRGGGIGMVYQDALSALNPSLTVGEQLAEVVVGQRGASWQDAMAEALAMLREAQLPDPARIAASYPHQLSGGQQQRAVIAMALIARPRLLLLDEPTTALDVTIEAQIVDLIMTLRRRHGTALLFISHNLGLVAQVCERVAVMYAGEIVEAGPVEAVFAAPRHPYTQGLMRCIPVPFGKGAGRGTVPIPGQPGDPRHRSTGCQFAARCRHAMPGLCDRGPVRLAPVAPDGEQVVRCVRSDTVAVSDEAGGDPRRLAAGADPILAVSGLDKTYGIGGRGLLASFARRRRQIRANRDLSFAVGRGETIAIVGESGSGKSTFAKVLTGLETADGGEIRFEGASLAMQPAQRRSPDLLRALQMVFQNPDETLNPSYSVGRQVARAIRKLGGGGAAGEARRLARELLGRVHLAQELEGRRPRQLSGGQKQRVAIARALAGTPKLIVADEPVSALDVSVRASITELLMEIRERQGTTFVLISHDLGLVRYVADRVVVMYLGGIVESGTVEAVFEPPWHPYTEALLSAVPIPDPSLRRRRIVLEGDLPDPAEEVRGCAFRTRCPRKRGPICDEAPPPLRQGPGDLRIACHIPVEELCAAQGAEPVAGGSTI